MDFWYDYVLATSLLYKVANFKSASVFCAKSVISIFLEFLTAEKMQPMYVVDAFTSEKFSGNPAAVCPLNLVNNKHN